MDLTSIWPDWGSTGSQPPDGRVHQSGDNPKAPYYNHLWFHIKDTFSSVESHHSHSFVHMDLTSIWPDWGSTGSQPPDGRVHQSGDNPKAPYYNHLWFHIKDTFSSVESWITSVENDVSTNESDISSLQSDKLDATNYTPVSDVDGEVSQAASSVSGLDGQVDTNDSDIDANTSLINTNASDITDLQNNKLDTSNYTPVSDVDGSSATTTGNVNLKVGGQMPVYASLSDVPDSITEGELVYISGDGLYVEDGT